MTRSVRRFEVREDVRAALSTSPGTAPIERRWPARAGLRYRACIEGCPYRVGSVIALQVDRDSYAVAVVLEVSAQRLESSGAYVARLRVARRTRRGAWSRCWEFTYPGPIERGFALWRRRREADSASGAE